MIDPSGDTKVCKACSYVLEGLNVPRCPECGQTFDPANPSTFRTVEYLRIRRVNRFVLAIIWAPIVLLTLLIVYLAIEFLRSL